MKVLLPLLTVLLLTMQIASAQETPEVSDWTTVERCITAPSQPPEGWTYNGVIFTFKPGDGVHARRADVATPYYVAFDSDSEFGIAGSISPNGRWIAVPAGNSMWTDTTFRKIHVTEEYRVYSTSPEHTLHWRIPVHRFGAYYSITWLDTDRLLVDGYIYNVIDHSVVEQSDPSVTSALDVGVAQLQESFPFLSRDSLPSLSADETMLAMRRFGAANTLYIADLREHTIIDTCLNARYPVAFSPDGRQLAFGLEPAGYVYILDIEAWEAYRIDLAAADVIGWYPLE